MTCLHINIEFEDGEWECTQCQTKLDDLPLPERPMIFADTGELAVQSDETWAALSSWCRRSDDPTVLVKDGVLVRATERDLEEYDRYSLREESSRAAMFGRQGTNAVTRTYPPSEVMDSLLRRDPKDYVGVPRVTAVVDVPVVSADGRLVSVPGIHESGLYYRPARGLEDITEADLEIDTVDSVRDARDLLMDELLGDFDFKNDASKVNALGLVLLPFVRPLIGDNPTPLHVVDARQAGSGKSTVAQACLIPGAGLVGFASEPRDDDELRKLITSSLLSGRSAIVFDNINSRMASGTLASALTSRKWQDRILGQSKEVSLPVRCIWVTTGNNWDAAGELVDRICPIQLEPRGEVARKRGPDSFRHPDLHGWALDSRRELVVACLTLVRHWLSGHARVSATGEFVRSDTRHGSESTLGSFERWADVIGGVLAAADVHGFLQNLDDARLSMDSEEHETRDFLRAWRTSMGDSPVTSDVLSGACQLGGPLAGALPATISTRDLVRSLRYWLRQHNGQRHGTLVLKSTDLDGRVKQWWVEEI